MGAGLVCHFTRPDARGQHLNMLANRVLQLGRWRAGGYTTDQVLECWIHNVGSHAGFAAELVDLGVTCFRVSSALLPLWDQMPDRVRHDPLIEMMLGEIGSELREAGIRVVTHPGQFSSLSARDPRVQAATLADLEMHGWILDAMGCPRSPDAAINVHGGGRDRVLDLIDGIDRMPPAVRSRLTLENDETCYTVEDLLVAHVATGVPIVWDSHHHRLNPGGLDETDADGVTRATWPAGVKPLQHMSNTDPSTPAAAPKSVQRKHSEMVHHIPGVQLSHIRCDTADVEFEFKGKNVAIATARKEFGW